MTFANYPNLRKAIQYMYACNGMHYDETRMRAIPIQYNSHEPFTDEALQAADQQAQELDGHPLSKFIPENMIDVDLADPDDDALEVLCDGEATIQDLLVTWSNSHMLHQVLESAFDGELHECISKHMSKRRTAARSL